MPTALETCGRSVHISKQLQIHISPANLRNATQQFLITTGGLSESVVGAYSAIAIAPFHQDTAMVRWSDRQPDG